MHTNPTPVSSLFLNSRPASVPLNHLFASPSSSQKIGRSTSRGRLWTYPQYLPPRPSLISCKRIRARVGTVKFVVAFDAQSLPPTSGINSSIGSLREVVRDDRIEVLGTLKTVISTHTASTRLNGDIRSSSNSTSLVALTPHPWSDSYISIPSCTKAPLLFSHSNKRCLDGSG